MSRKFKQFTGLVIATTLLALNVAGVFPQYAETAVCREKEKEYLVTTKEDNANLEEQIPKDLKEKEVDVPQACDDIALEHETKVMELTKTEVEELEDENLIVEENIELEGSRKRGKDSVTENVHNDFSVLGVDREKTEKMDRYIRIAVLDSGIDIKEEYQIVHQVNFVKDEQEVVSYLEDSSGHGTSIASVISEIAPHARIESLKVLNQENKGKLNEIVSAIYWCIENKVKIINMSFGTRINSRILHQAIRDAYDSGILLVAAAGNGGTNTALEFPAAYEEVMAVGGVTKGGQVSNMSSGGEQAELMGICEDVVTDAGFSQYLEMEGTSLAVPQVSAIASLLWGMDTDKSAGFIRELLNYSAQQNGAVDLNFAMEHYQVFEQNYDEETIDLSLLEQNDGEDKEAEFEARWSKSYHYNMVKEHISGLSANELSVLRYYVKAPDFKDGFPVHLRSKYLHALPYKDTDEFQECNYVAVMRYLFRIARYLDNGKSFKEATKIAYVLGAKNSRVEDSINAHIQLILEYDSTVDAKITSKKRLRALKVFGAALHVAGDTYAHRTLVEARSYPLDKNGNNDMSPYAGDMRLDPNGQYIDLRFFTNDMIAGGNTSKMYRAICSPERNFVTQRLDYAMKTTSFSYADKIEFYPERYSKGTKTAMQEMVESWKKGDTTMNGKVIKNRGGCKYSLHKSATYLKEAKY